MGAVNVPALIIQGTTDLQVTVTDAEALKKGNPEAKLVLIDGMNHVLKVAPQDREGNLATYMNNKIPLHEQLLPTITEFVLSH